MATSESERAPSTLVGATPPDRPPDLPDRHVGIATYHRTPPFLSIAGRALLPAALVAISGGLLAWNALLVNLMATRLHMNDFGKFYYSALAFLHGQDMYGPSPATLMPMGELESQQLWNLNPPHFHIPLLPLALLPPEGALAVWGVASLLALLVSLWLIFKEIGLTLTPFRLLLVIAGALAFAGSGATFVSGQLSFLLLLPVILAWLEARRGRWTRAGAYLGLAMSVKLFLLVFLPFFVLRRRFGAVLAMIGVAALCFLAGLLVFGVEAHSSWLRVLASSNDWSWLPMNASLLGLLSRTLSGTGEFASLVDAPGLVRILWLGGVGLVGAFTAAAVIRPRSATSVDRDFGLLLLAAQIVSPLGWIYYLSLAAGPVIVLVAKWWRESRQRAIDPDGARWRYIFLLAAIPGLVWPTVGTTLFQPAAWATIAVGSAYFWATTALWCSLLADWHAGKGSPPVQGQGISGAAGRAAGYPDGG